jgi:hypothetical protein
MSPLTFGRRKLEPSRRNRHRGICPNWWPIRFRWQQRLGLLMAAGDPRPGTRGSGDWERRIGSEAAISMRLMFRYLRIGTSCVLVWVAFVIGFQVANIPLEMEKNGITLSTLWMVAAIVFWVFRHECGSPNGFELGFLLLRQRFCAGAEGLWFVPVLRRFFNGSRQFG